MCADNIDKRIDRCKADVAQFANPRLQTWKNASFLKVNGYTWYTGIALTI